MNSIHLLGPFPLKPEPCERLLEGSVRRPASGCLGFRFRADSRDGRIAHEITTATGTAKHGEATRLGRREGIDTDVFHPLRVPAAVAAIVEPFAGAGPWVLVGGICLVV